MAIDPGPSSEAKKSFSPTTLLVFALLLLVLAGGAYFRFVGLDWGEYTFMHPDERFLLMVGSAIQPVQSLGEYFNTAVSTLNPHNQGHGFYVYGTLPLFLARYVVQGVYGYANLMEITEIGRGLSALFDFMTVLLVFAIARRLYGSAAALMSAAFMAFSVLNIQQAHFFTMDTFITFFTVLAIYFSVRVLGRGDQVNVHRTESVEQSTGEYFSPTQSLAGHPEDQGYAAHAVAFPAAGRGRFTAALTSFASHPLFWLSIGFGAALGMAVASKINAAPVAMMLPLAAGMILLTRPTRDRQSLLLELFPYLVLAAFVSLLVFRIFQPYAFSGPGFFGISPNPNWVANLREQRIQAAGDIDFPPAMQWARRPVWFSFQNMVMWGMGLPFGLLAWAGFIWMGWRIFKGEWRPHLLLWSWTAFYFLWQSLQFNPTMRYQLPIYPILAVIAGWTLVALYRKGERSQRSVAVWRTAALLVGVLALAGTLAWAYAFSGVYIRPFTRAEASRWIFQNIPGPVNLRVENQGQVDNHIIPYPYGFPLSPANPYYTGFEARSSGILSEIYLPEVLDQSLLQSAKSLTLVISSLPFGSQPLAYASLDAYSDGSYTVRFDQPAYLEENSVYYLTLYSLTGELPVDVCGPLTLIIQTPVDAFPQELGQPVPCLLSPNEPFTTAFSAEATGMVGSAMLSRVSHVEETPQTKVLRVEIIQPGEGQVLASGTLRGLFTREENNRQDGYRITLDQAVTVEQGQRYDAVLSISEGQGGIILQGGTLANEGDWDDGLPLRLWGYDGFGGIYQPGLNFNMYTDDNPEKLERFYRVLDQSEYLVISSNRQWGSLPRIPERFPLVTAYYRSLLGCPVSKSILWCYSVAAPGNFEGDLGFELVEVFQSDPQIGPVRFNTQFAEEAFTVYDHPKVLVFRKTASYDPEHVRRVLGAVDLNQVIRLTPKRAPSYPADLLLPPARLQEQQQGGTWSEIFDSLAVHNRVQVLGTAVWYLALLALGLAAYPWVRLALPGLPDRGYPLARTAGMVLLAYLVWGAGSLRLPFTQATILVVFGLIASAGAGLAFIQRDGIKRELSERWRYYLTIETLFLAFFVFALLIRLGNPDLWHPYKGGEKPMDFAYFNAVLKSTSFPPYDPWFAGGYLNYYYYGFVLVGVLTKALAIVPAFAYNLILPTILMLVAMGAFSAAWNIYQRSAPARQRLDDRLPSPYLVGIAAAFFMTVLGNLGTVRMIGRGYQIVGAPGGMIEEGDIFTRLYWTITGLIRTLQGARLPYSLGDWYWIPSRTIPAQGDYEPITEFPFFTFLYGDPHAHLFALPVALLALGFVLAVVFGRFRWPNPLMAGASFLMGGLAIGALYPINLSDIYTYLPLGLAALAYTSWRYYDPTLADWLPGAPPWIKRGLVVVLSMALLAGLAFLLYQPYRTWYGQAYSSVDPWRGPTTPSGSYFTHWGLFLFVFATWMAWETREWMASTPLSALGRLAPYKGLIQGALAVLLLVVALLVWTGVRVAWIALPLAAWAGVLLLRPDRTDTRRTVLFLIGTGLAITVMVEMVVVRGDVGRMNTVFKFYLQAWTLFAVSAAVAVGWVAASFHRWSAGWRAAWQVPFALLVVSAALFTLLGTTAKIKDRMNPSAPHTLDGMAYMQVSTYDNMGTLVDLNQDYQAIRWMQENVQGSPVIVEAASPNQYAWFARFSNYTGLPSVLGWQWHQIQQRGMVQGERVPARLSQISEFYMTRDASSAVLFLQKYNIQYIIVGQVERGYYPGGMDKFARYDGVLWTNVYRDQDTAIYQVLK